MLCNGFLLYQWGRVHHKSILRRRLHVLLEEGRALHLLNKYFFLGKILFVGSIKRNPLGILFHALRIYLEQIFRCLKSKRLPRCIWCSCPSIHFLKSLIESSISSAQRFDFSRSILRSCVLIGPANVWTVSKPFELNLIKYFVSSFSLWVKSFPHKV